MRTWILILTVCLALCHSYHLRQEALQTERLELIRELWATQLDLNESASSKPGDTTACPTTESTTSLGRLINDGSNAWCALCTGSGRLVYDTEKCEWVAQ